MENSSPKLSIIVLNYKTRGLLRQFLRGLLAHPPSCSYEIIVIDNGSGDGSVELMQTEFADIKLIVSTENLGYTRGTNLGVKEANGEYLWFVNTDVVVLQGSHIDTLVSALDSHPQYGAVGPQLRYPDNSLQYSCFRYYTPVTPFLRRSILGRTKWGKQQLAHFLMSDWDHSTEREVEWLMSSNLMVKRNVLDKIGGWDERYFIYFSDVDLCRSIWQAGYKVAYIPSAMFVHYLRRQSKSDFRIAIYHAIDFLRYLWKWLGK